MSDTVGSLTFGGGMEPRVTPTAERMATHENLLNVRIASSRSLLRGAKLANRKASHEYKLGCAKFRLQEKAKEMGKPISAEALSARVIMAHEEEPILGLYLAHQKSMAEVELAEDAVDNLKDELDMVKYNYFNPMQGMRR